MCAQEPAHSSEKSSRLKWPVLGKRETRDRCWLLKAEFGEKRDFSASYGKVSRAVQRECCFLRVRAKECDSDADKCEFSLLHYLRVGVFSPQS